MHKRFAKTADQIKDLIPRQDGCIASDRIMVDGGRVGYMYRAEPNDSADSGWNFFAGDESDDYADDPDNFGVYALNTVANYDPNIIPLLDAPVGSAYKRNWLGRLVPDSRGAP